MISVVMPVYCRDKQGLEWLAEALASVQKQTLKPEELVIVDDCSPVDITPVLEGLTVKTEYIRNTGNLRQAGSRQKGLEAAKGDILAFLDQDDLWAGEYLEKQLAVMTETGADMVFSDMEFMKMNGADSPVCHTDRSNIPRESSFLSLFQRGNYAVSFSCCLIKRAPLLAAGGMNTNYTSMDDFDLFLRLSEKGRIIFNSQRLATYRIHVAAANRNVKLFNDSRLLLRLYFRHFCTCPSDRAVMAPRLVKKLLALVYYKLRNK